MSQKKRVEPLFVLRGHRAAVNTVSWGPQGHYLLSGDVQGVLKMWDLSTRRCLHSWQGHSDKGILSLTLISTQLPDEARTVVLLLSQGKDGWIKFWKMPSVLENNNQNNQSASSATAGIGGSSIGGAAAAAAAAAAGAARDAAVEDTPVLIAQIECGSFGFCSISVLGPRPNDVDQDKYWMVTPADEPSALLLWDVRAILAHADAVCPLNIPCGASRVSQLLLGNEDEESKSPVVSPVSTIHVDPPSAGAGKRKHGMVMSARLVRPPGSSADQLAVIVGTEAGGIGVFSALGDCAPLLKAPGGVIPVFEDKTPVLSLGFAHAAAGIAGSANDQLAAWKIDWASRTAKAQVISTTLSTPGTGSIKVRADRRVVAASGWDGRVRLFNWKTLKLIAVLKFHEGSVYSVDWDDNLAGSCTGPISLGKLATGGKDMRIAVWNLFPSQWTPPSPAPEDTALKAVATSSDAPALRPLPRTPAGQGSSGLGQALAALRKPREQQ